MIFILEHQLILLRSPLLDPSEQTFHVSCAAGTTPSTIWAEAQTYIPAHTAWKAEGEEGFLGTGGYRKQATVLGCWGLHNSLWIHQTLCRTMKKKRDCSTMLTNTTWIYLNRILEKFKTR